MPFGPFYPIRDKNTGKSYQMPWEDMTRKPTEDDVRNFVYEQETRGSGLEGLWNKLNEPLSDVISRNVKKRIAEPLYQYGEYADLSPEETVSARRNPLRHAARYGGAFLESLGLVGDQALTSPVGAITTAATGGTGLAAKMGATRVAQALPYVGKAAGAGQVAHGAQGLNRAMEKGSYREAVGPAIETALGLVPFAARGAPRAKASSQPRPKVGDIIDAEYAYNAEPISEGLATRGTGSVVRPDAPRHPAGYLPDISPDAPIVPSGPAGLPPRPGAGGLPPKSTAGPFYGGRRGVSTDIEDVIDLAPLSQTPAEAAHYSMIPERYKPQSTTSNRGVKGPFEHIPDISEEGFFPKAGPEYSQPRPKGELSKWPKRPTMTEAEKRAKEAAARLDESVSERRYSELKSKFGGTATTKVADQPVGGKAWQRLQDLLSEEKGELDISALADAFRRGKERVTNVVKSEKGQKFLGKEIAKDPSEIPLKGAWQSGWGYLRESGEAGQKLERLLSKARLDFERLAAQNKLPELPGGKGKVGSLIHAQYKDEIKDLINQIPDEAQRSKVQEITDIFLGQKQPQLSQWKPSVEFAKKMEAASKLSQFAIQNSVTLANNFMRGNVGATFEALMETVTNSKAAMETARKSGALHPLYNEILREISTSPKKDTMTEVLNKAFGIEWSEGKMRTMSALTGRATAKEIFEQLKANPGNKRARVRLDDLVLEDVDKLLKQKGLTEDQLDRAAARMSEITQGRAESIDLPPMWSGHPLADLATQFKRYGFAQTRNIKEALKKDPYRATAALLTALPVMGEIAGDLKAVVKGTAKGMVSKEDEVMESIKEELEGRGTGLKRYMADAEQAWVFGLFKDIWNAMGRGPRGMTEYVAGPAISDVSKISSGIYTGLNEERWEPLERELVRPLPYGIGPALAEDIEGSYVGRQQRRSREGRTRSRRRY